MHSAVRRRPDILVERLETSFGVVERPLSPWQRIANSGTFRKGAILVIIAAVWQFYATRLGNPFVLPTFTATFDAFVTPTAPVVLKQAE